MGTASSATRPRRMGPLIGCGKARTRKGIGSWSRDAEHLHLKQARDSEGTVIRVTRFGAADSQRDPRVSWFLWVGQAPAPLARVWSLYKRRYSQEHGYRGHSQALLWDQPRLRTPEQFERWTRLLAAVQNQLVLARPLVAAVRLPWESSTRPVTPQQVRRAMAGILATDGAHPPKRPKHAENRQAGPKAESGPLPHAFRSSKNPNPCPKSVANGPKLTFLSPFMSLS